MSSDARKRLAARFREAGLDTERFIQCLPGQKGTHDHEQHPPERVNGNYGVYANGDDRLCILDIDDYGGLDDKSGFSALAKLPATFEQESPHGGTHRFYVVEATSDGHLVSGALTDAFGASKGNLKPSWGEVRCNNQYVVGAGSQLDGCDKSWCDECAQSDGGQYVIQNDTPIATVSAETLIDVLSDDPALSTDTQEAPDTPDGLAADADVSERVDFARKHDDLLDALLRGDYSEYRDASASGGVDRSKAEYVLAFKLAYWLEGDKAAVERVLDHELASRTSHGEPAKWHEREDASYRENVLSGVDDQTEYFDPNYNGGDALAADTPDRVPDQVGGSVTPDQANPKAREDTDVPADESEWTVQDKINALVLWPLNPESDEADPIAHETAIDRTADIFCEEWAFLRPREDTRGWRDTLYVYSADDGIYEPHGEAFVERKAEALLGQFATNQRVNEIVGKIERRSRISERRLSADPERLVVRNGILDLTAGELHEHTPAEYHRTMIDVPWDPDAECPAIDSFLHDVVGASDVPTLYRLIAHCLYKEYAAEKAAMLLGDGQNGKSVFLSLVEEFLCGWNVSNKSLQELNEDEWAANNLVGKLANVHPDMSDQTVETMQMFKKLTGRDTISANVKFEEPIRFENYATLVFACNRMPVLKDDTRGNWRRWILVDFPNTFERGTEEFVEKRALMDRLTQLEELQGLLVRCVEEIKRWDRGEAWFPTTPGWQETRRRIRRAAEPVYDFAHACLTESDGGHEPATDVRDAYRNYATQEGLPNMSRESFGRKLQSLPDFAVSREHKRLDGDRVYVYTGIQFTARGQQLAYGGDDPETKDQSSLGGARGRADRIVALTQDHYDHNGGVDHEFLKGVAVAEGMDQDKAESAIQKALNRGDLVRASSDTYRPA